MDTSIWVLLWSQKQGMLHYETLDRMLETHREAFFEDRELQYIPLAVGSRDEVQAVADSIRPTVAQRYNTKHQDEDGFIPYENHP